MANLYLTPLCLGATDASKISGGPSLANTYIVKYAPIAQSLSNKTGIPASIILGVALIESGHGGSQNCMVLKNHFGIKGTNHLPKKGINYFSVYRSYTSDEASFGHFCTIIKRKSYYAKLKGNKDYKIWLLEINKGYYSSAGMTWVNRIQHAIEKHKLHRFDQPKIYLANSPRLNWLHA
jgi:Bax protein